jgi:hypothetical protein
MVERTALQMEIELPRKRAALIEDTAEVTLRVPKAPAAVVNAAAPGVVTTALGRAFETLLKRQPGETVMDAIQRREAEQAALTVWDAIGYTPWFTDAPPFSGSWQIRQKAARLTTTHQRPWYDAQTRMWFAPGWVAPIPHSQLMMSHFWRGLVRPDPRGYPYRVPGLRVRLLD